MIPEIRSSSSDRAFNCHGSITVTALVDERDGDEGFEGVALHHRIAERAISELGAIAPEGGLLAPDVPQGYCLPPSSLWIVDWAIRHIRETIPADWSLMVEVEMEYSHGRWKQKGHADLLAISPDGTRCKGKDYKTGRKPVDPADNNWQVASYLSLAKLTWPSLISGEFEICQPRVCEEDGYQRISYVEVPDLAALCEVMNAEACKALDNPMRLKTGPWCQYCIGPSCPALQAEQQFMEITMTPEMLAKIKRTPDDAQLADFVIVGRRLEKPLKDATEMLHERLDKNPAIVSGSGQTITRKIQRGSYTVDQPVEFFRAAREMLVTDERMSKVYEPSMTRLVDEVASLMDIPKQGKSAVTGQGVVDAKFKPYVTQGERRLLQIL